MPSPRHLNSGDRENAHRKDGDGPFAVRVDRNEKLPASCLNTDSFRIDSGQTQDEDAQVAGSSGFLESCSSSPIHPRARPYLQATSDDPLPALPSRASSEASD